MADKGAWEHSCAQWCIVVLHGKLYRVWPTYMEMSSTCAARPTVPWAINATKREANYC